MTDTVKGVGVGTPTASVKNVHKKPKTTEAQAPVNIPIGKKPQKQEVKKFPEYDETKFKSYAEYEQKKAVFNKTQDLKSNKLTYDNGKVFGLQIFKPEYVYHADGKETLGDIKERYNLPDKSLGNQSTGGGGNFDLLKAQEYVEIPVTAMDKGTAPVKPKK